VDSKLEMRFLVFDFETTGVGTDSSQNYRPHGENLKPLPRANYPVELAAQIVEFKDGQSMSVEEIPLRLIVKGATRFDPWVEKNCSHLSVQTCDTIGVEFEELLRLMAKMVNEQTILISHNIHYDWDMVLKETAKEKGLLNDKNFLTLAACRQMCTCVNIGHESEGRAYFYHRIGKWIGPKLSALAERHQVTFDADCAHNAMYDVNIVCECLKKMNRDTLSYPKTRLF
tara:strand:+ start:2292 stop:2975 length:684 start_codon:yes stop_codon:yes gene_type:complete